ncbi:uncharacterized protein C2orf72 homolog [Octodon degus]|uniref:Uncharacterized protein C2orf72 homolog n=1 Tax=Octodon degus TaxID=10160 RepID=A0A6P6F0R0_OCTDE|nr:uncharacterized protein C2orf72 homolog [Octodon degus]
MTKAPEDTPTIYKDLEDVVQFLTPKLQHSKYLASTGASAPLANANAPPVALFLSTSLHADLQTKARPPTDLALRQACAAPRKNEHLLQDARRMSPREAEGTWERPRFPGLLSCFAWGPWGHRKERDAIPSQGSSQETRQDSEDELALTAIFPNGDCEDRGSGLRALDRPTYLSHEQPQDSR